MAKKKHPGNPHPQAPTAASRQAMHRIAQPRWTTQADGYLPITAPVDPTYRSQREEDYIHRTPEDLYGFLVRHGRPQDDN